MREVKIKKNIVGDTRTATSVPTFHEFFDANYDHSDEVERMMVAFSEEIRERSLNHDWTKMSEPYSSIFYRELCDVIEGKMDFSDGKWFDKHCKLERHHLLERCPDDVNLVDVIEMICDCVCAGMARSGKFRPLEIDDEILRRAVQNTVQMCLDAVEMEEQK